MSLTDMLFSGYTKLNPMEADEGVGFFPYQYLHDFLRFLYDYRGIIEYLTYDDLNWSGDYNWEDSYPKEWQAWQEQIKSGERDPKTIYLLIQHDVDSFPEQTIKLLRDEEKLGIRSNVMIFNRRISRKTLSETGNLQYTSYNLNYPYLEELEKKGFLIGYHCNAYEQALFNLEQARTIFEEDVTTLRTHFNINHFSPHGGTRDSEGRSNNIIEVPESLNNDIRWVHNRYAVKSNGRYSDGGMNSGKRDPDAFNLARFAKTWRLGYRYHILLHPQYYCSPCSQVHTLKGVRWYDEVFNSYAYATQNATFTDKLLIPLKPAQYWRGVTFDAICKRKRTWVKRIELKVSYKARYREQDSRPIFVRGVSRSGGTLLVTLLDSHPDISMSYELYPTLLAGEQMAQADIRQKAEYGGKAELSPPLTPQQVIQVLSEADNYKQALKQIEGRNLKTFITRCQRSGLTLKHLLSLLEQYRQSGLDFSSTEGQMTFMKLCCQQKMFNFRKTMWGLKCSNNFEDYSSIWPDACFINIIRDGRDVLASQLNTGSFNDTPEDIGKMWAETHLRFRALRKQKGIRTHELLYENLVYHTESELARLCAFLRVPFSPLMLEHHKQDLTIYKASHLSKERIVKPIDDSKIGRWKSELNKDQLERFYSTTREAMELFGYLEEEKEEKPAHVN